MSYYVYMLKSVQKKPVTYVGYTKNLKNRIRSYFQNSKIQSKKKFNEKTIQMILDLREINDKLSQKDFLKKIELENNIKCSISTFKKIIDKMY